MGTQSSGSTQSFRFLATLALSLISILNAQAKKALPLPEAKVVKSQMASAEEALRGMYFSERFEVRPELQQKIFPTPDLIGEEVKALAAFCADASARTIYVARYGLGDSDAEKALLECAKKGPNLQLLVDLNRALEGRGFSEKSTFEFSKLGYLSDKSGKPIPMARTVDALLKAGFAYNAPHHGIFSQAVYNADVHTVKPIFHEKAMIMVGANGAQMTLSTANWSGSPRVNRTFFIGEPLLVQRYIDHLEQLKAGFADGKNIAAASGVDEPILIEYADGTSIRMSFTAGKYNPNDRIRQLYEEAVAKKIKIKKTYLSEFVLTNKGVLESIVNHMKADHEAELFGVFEDQFIDLFGWGVAPALAGFDVYPPAGKRTFAVGAALSKRMELYGYQRPVLKNDGEPVEQGEEDGPPLSRYLWHDKTHVALVEKDGKNWYVIHTGSFNLSNHIDNAEAQLEIWLPETSPIAQGIVDSIVLTARSQKEWALPLRTAIARNAVGALSGHTDLELPVPRVEAVIAALVGQQYAKGIEGLEAIRREIPSKLKKRPSDEEFAERIAKLKKFFKWYAGLKLPAINAYHQARKIVGLSIVLSRPELKSFVAAQIVRNILWRPNMNDSELDPMVEAGLAALGIEAPPPSKAAADDSVTAILAAAAPRMAVREVPELLLGRPVAESLRVADPEYREGLREILEASTFDESFSCEENATI